jgi:Tfp pilus assembly protein PilF
MRFGIDKQYLIIFTALLILFGNACSQTKEKKMVLAKDHNEKALEFIYRGNAKDAIQEQLKAIELDDKNIKFWIEIAGFYLDVDDVKNARNAAEKIIEIDKKNAWGHFLYAEVLEKSGDEKGGFEEIKLACELDNENLLFLTNLGIAQENINDVISAKVTYEKVLNKNPNYIFSLVRLGLLEIDLGNKQKAITLFEEAVKQKPIEIGDESFIKVASDKLAELKSKKKIENKKP